MNFYIGFLYACMYTIANSIRNSFLPPIELQVFKHKSHLYVCWSMFKQGCIIKQDDLGRSVQWLVGKLFYT